MSALHLGPDFTLPVDAASGRYVLLGKSGAGKTNTDALFIEQVYDAGVAPVVLDPLGNLWGLRASSDGEGGGLPIAIFGGAHGDVPLREDRAEYLADLIAEGVPSVLDLSEMTPDRIPAFAGEFLDRLLKRAMIHRANLFVVVEEADRFARNAARSTTVTTWARASRNAGIGWLFSTHRPQILHHEITDSANCFLAMRMTGELAQDAIGGEIGSRMGKGFARSIIADLPNLGNGEAWFVPDPDWLRDGTDWTSRRVKFALRRTFHVEPPKVGQTHREPRVLAEVEITRLRRALEADSLGKETLPESSRDEEKTTGTKGFLTKEKVVRVEVPVRVPIFTKEMHHDLEATRKALARWEEEMQTSLARLGEDLQARLEAIRVEIGRVLKAPAKPVALEVSAPSVLHVTDGSDAAPSVAKPRATPQGARAGR